MLQTIEPLDHARPTQRRALVVLDFDGFLVNSFALLRSTFERFGLDLGDEARFQDRRKFLKYTGGGKEFVFNLVSYSLPRKRAFRLELTEEYEHAGRVYPEFVPLINRLIEDPRIQVGVVSRNFTLQPGLTIRSVLRNSGVLEHDLDFVIPIPIGADKDEVLRGMRSSRHGLCLLGADEIGDFNAAERTGYTSVIGSYGFDQRKRLISKGGVPESILADDPAAAVELLTKTLALESGPERRDGSEPSGLQLVRR